MKTKDMIEKLEAVLKGADFSQCWQNEESELELVIEEMKRSEPEKK